MTSRTWLGLLDAACHWHCLATSLSSALAIHQHYRTQHCTVRFNRTHNNLVCPSCTFASSDTPHPALAMVFGRLRSLRLRSQNSISDPNALGLAPPEPINLSSLKAKSALQSSNTCIVDAEVQVSSRLVRRALRHRPPRADPQLTRSYVHAMAPMSTFIAVLSSFSQQL